MVPHYSGMLLCHSACLTAVMNDAILLGTTLDAQKRYADGVKSIIDNYMSGKQQEAQNIIVGGKIGYATKACANLFLLYCPFVVLLNTLS